MTSSPLTITISYDGWICVLSAIGDLDLTNAARFDRCASRALDDRPERLVFDLAELTFLDCAGARALAAAAEAAPPGCPVIVRSVSPIAARLLVLLSLNLERRPAMADAPRPAPDPRPTPAHGQAGTGLRVADLDRVSTRARLIRAARDLAVTEEQIAATCARLAAESPSRADRLTAVSQSAHAYATRTLQCVARTRQQV